MNQITKLYVKNVVKCKEILNIHEAAKHNIKCTSIPVKSPKLTDVRNSPFGIHNQNKQILRAKSIPLVTLLQNFKQRSAAN